MTKNLPTTNQVTYWQPSAGETITGVIQGSGTFNNLLYDEQKTMLLQDNNGSVVCVALNRYLIHSLKHNFSRQRAEKQRTFFQSVHFASG
jgi:hypothetical protein